MRKFVCGFGVFFLSYAVYADPGCGGAFQANPLAEELRQYALNFAATHKLPTREIVVGPKELPQRRTVIALDATDAAMTKAYLDAFNLNTRTGNIGGMFVLESTFEAQEGYIWVWIRESNNPAASGWRFAKRNNESFTKLMGDSLAQTRVKGRPIDIIAHSNPIALTADMRVAALNYIEHPASQLKPRHQNCVDFIPCIDLRIPANGAATPAKDRLMVSHYLGFSRTDSHDEIARRFVHAANENHTVTFLLLNGKAEFAKFQQVAAEQLLPPVPKKSFREILHNYDQRIAARIAALQPQVPVAAVPPPPPPRPAIDVALDTIQDGDKIFFPIGAGASADAFLQLIQRSKNFVKGVDVFLLVSGIGEKAIRRAIEESGGKIRVHSLFLGQSMRAPYAEGLIDVHPGYLSDFARLIADHRNPDFQFNSLVIRVAPADEQGRYSLGANNDHIMTILKFLRPRGLRVIAEVNPNVPRTTGDNFVTEENIDAMFPSDAPLPGPTRLAVKEIEAAIGENLASLVDDGSTIQIGIGNTFDGLPAAMARAGRQNIFIRTEMFGDALMDLMKSGVAYGAITGFAYGSPELYKWLNGNAKVNFWETDYANNPVLIGQIPQFVAINTALQVTLYGEINATFGPNGRISSPGGQVEFMSGAAKSVNGKSIIAIRSTAKEETLSSIVLDPYPGPITTPSEMVSHVVTEYGVAYLRGATERERAVQLINIAHPKFRLQLFNDATRWHLLKEEDKAKIRFE